MNQRIAGLWIVSGYCLKAEGRPGWRQQLKKGEDAPFSVVGENSSRVKFEGAGVP